MEVQDKLFMTVLALGVVALVKYLNIVPFVLAFFQPG